MLRRSFGCARVRVEKFQRSEWLPASLRETLTASFRSGNSNRSGPAAARIRGPSSGSTSISRRTASRMSLSSFFVSFSLVTFTFDLRSSLALPSHGGLDLPQLIAHPSPPLCDLVEQVDRPVASARRRLRGRLEGPLDRGAQRLGGFLRAG